MVNMVGFHHKEPEYNTAGVGEPGYFVKIRPTPTAQYPLRARVRTPTGGIIFYTPEEATEWSDTPHRHMAETYIKWTKDTTND